MSSREENSAPSLAAVSGATLGCLCTYILEFGTSHQKTQTLALKNYIREKIKENETSVGKDVQNEVDWKDLRQRLYTISGDWLWLHATNHWKLKVASQMIIPSELIEEALSVQQLDNDKQGISPGTSSSMMSTPESSEVKAEYSIDMKEFDSSDRNSYFETHNHRLELKRSDVLSDPAEDLEERQF